MAHIKPSEGIDKITHALSKERDAEGRLYVGRQKHFHDPVTGQVVGVGPNEYYAQSKRDYSAHPRTEGEEKQVSKWSEACKASLVIIRDPTHPRYNEMRTRWLAQLGQPKACKQFGNFVRAVMAREGVARPHL